MADVTPARPFERGAASREIYAVLRDEILTSTLAPGLALDETSLSRRFSVSRSPIREALNRLLADRLVEMLPNRSTIVSRIDSRHFAPFIQALDVQQRLASRLAARNRTPADVQRLRELADAFDSCIEDSVALEVLQANYAFHMAVGEAGRNPYVVRQYGELLSEARRLLHMHVEFLTMIDRTGVLRDQHHDFVDAIEAQDVAAADVVAHEHTMQFHDRFLSAMRHVPDTDFDLSVGTDAVGR